MTNAITLAATLDQHADHIAHEEHMTDLQQLALRCVIEAWLGFLDIANTPDGPGFAFVREPGFGRLTQEIANRARIIAVEIDWGVDVGRAGGYSTISKQSELGPDELERRANANHTNNDDMDRYLFDEALCHEISLMLGDGD